MGRPKNSLDVTQAECAHMRALYVQGVRITDIVRRTGRCESVVSHAVRGMKRIKPPARPWTTKRNALIVRRVLQDGVSQAAAARRFQLSRTMVCQIVREALGLRAKKRPDLKSWVKRLSASLREPPPLVGKAGREPRTRAQRLRRDREIYRLVIEKGVAQVAVARRYGLSTTGVRKVVERRLLGAQGP
jgi:Mor family transcriptional regulator